MDTAANVSTTTRTNFAIAITWVVANWTDDRVCIGRAVAIANWAAHRPNRRLVVDAGQSRAVAAVAAAMCRLRDGVPVRRVAIGEAVDVITAIAVIATNAAIAVIVAIAATEATAVIVVVAIDGRERMLMF